ncbi:thiamine pyrophosphate-binding protein [Mycolicibacterium sp. OfavD-34-C]|uniref:thiamine pyrophosphate-binding protein n=1 Tax=Mycolicibacterium sp. OfavD-34-C TaxID=2917746 RepID=UPI001EF569BB|nr:thiamine pyrophosphate-binding protein [Mycolicibacterium sp. OfavD-34-C]MCG7578734.1 thiamine pyrophosphate-dependent enzyme [Mycolicibacterium sp. OfavD-34-C]
MNRNGGAAVVETLAAHGIDTVFGIPGTHNLELYRHLSANGIRAITPRHEQGAGYAAGAYAWVTGRPGVVVTTSGPGLTNAMTAAATAYAESQPLLVISPGMPTGTEGRDLGQLHEAKNTSAAMDQLVHWSRRVRSSDEAADAVADAFAGFRAGRPRPVHIEIPVDVLEQQWTGTPRTPVDVWLPGADPACVSRAADVLGKADRPLIIAGGGAVDAQAEVTALAERLGAPVATTVNGKGVVAESHRLSVGASIRLPALQEAAADSDGLLLIGTELGDSDLWGGQIRGRTVIRCDIDAAQLHKNCPAGHVLLGDARATVRALLSELPDDAAPDSGRAATLRDQCHKEALPEAGIHAEINTALRQALPVDSVLAGDSSQVTYFGSVHFFDMPAPRRFCYSPGFATLGYGLPAGLGAAIALPGTPVAVLLGDGAMMFAVQELATLVQHRLPVPVVVVDSGGYQEILDQERSRDIAPIGVELNSPDFAALAVAMGARGERTTSVADLPDLITSALGAAGPTVIHFDIR